MENKKPDSEKKLFFMLCVADDFHASAPIQIVKALADAQMRPMMTALGFGKGFMGCGNAVKGLENLAESIAHMLTSGTENFFKNAEDPDKPKKPESEESPEEKPELKSPTSEKAEVKKTSLPEMLEGIKLDSLTDLGGAK